MTLPGRQQSPVYSASSWVIIAVSDTAHHYYHQINVNIISITVSKTYSGSYFGKGSSGSTISITYNCYGYENRLSSCRQSVPVLNTCTNSHLAGIRCTCEQNNKILHGKNAYIDITITH